MLLKTFRGGTLEKKTLQATGFTLMELVISLSVVALLSSIAVPKLLAVKTDAATVKIQSVASILTFASVTNKAMRAADNSKGSPIANCQDIVSLMEELDSDFQVAPLVIPNGAKVACTVNGPGNASATFSGHGIV